MDSAVSRGHGIKLGSGSSFGIHQCSRDRGRTRQLMKHAQRSGQDTPEDHSPKDDGNRTCRCDPD